MDKKIKILIISIVILVIAVVAIAIIINSNSNNAQTGDMPRLTIKEKRFNFGVISMTDGLARHTFKIENTGGSDLKIRSIKTSCMCTKAVLQVGGKKSPEFGMHTSSVGWSESIKPGQTAELEVIFDPNAHGPNATGPITRTVTLLSNNKGKNSYRTEITFTANVIK